MLCGMAWSCVVAALFSVIGDLLGVATLYMHHRKANHAQSFDQFKQLDPELLQEDWDVRKDLRPLEVAAGMWNAAAWIVLTIPIFQVTWHLSASGTHLRGLHAAMAVLMLVGCATEFASHVMLIGSTAALEWLATDFNMDYWLGEVGVGDPDGIGWRSLEVTYIALRGTLVWIDAVEWLFLGAILFLMFLSIQRQQHGHEVLSLAFGGYGLVLSLVCWIDFSTEVLRFKSWRTFAQLAFLISLFSRLLLWPVWFLWLGRQLGRGLGKQTMTSTTLSTPSAAEMIAYPSEAPTPVVAPEDTGATEAGDGLVLT